MSNQKTVNCPHCHCPISAGHLLGQLSRGSHRILTPDQIARKRQTLVLARERLAEQRAEKKRLDWLKIPVDYP